MIHDNEECIASDDAAAECEFCGEWKCPDCHVCPNLLGNDEEEEFDDPLDQFFLLEGVNEEHEQPPPPDIPQIVAQCGQCQGTNWLNCDVCVSFECGNCHNFAHKKRARRSSLSSGEKEAVEETVEDEENSLPPPPITVPLHIPATLDKAVDRIGVATWNVAHFGITPPALVNKVALFQQRVAALEKAYMVFCGEAPADSAPRTVKERFGKMKDGYETALRNHRQLLEKLRKQLGSKFPPSDAEERAETQEKKRLRPTRTATSKSVVDLALNEAGNVRRELTLSKTKDLLRRESHKTMISDGIAGLFQANDWLDVLVLQEVGLGMTRLHDDLASQGLRLLSGPLLQSSAVDLSTEEHAESDEEEEEGEGEEEEKEEKEDKRGQREYYPIVIRQSSPFKYRGWVAIRTDGSETPSLVDGEDAEAPDLSTSKIRWRKQELNYRPVLAHVLRAGERTFHIAVIHTSPGAVPGQQADHEFKRANEFLQIEKALAKSTEGTWIYGGDFYLSREARVRDPHQLIEDEDEEFATLVDDLYQEYVDLYKNDTDNRKFYRDLVRTQKNGTLQEKYELILKAADPGTVLSSTLVKTERDDFLRNALELTFQANVPAHLEIQQSVSGTNWHGAILLGPVPSGTSKRAKQKRAEYYAVARIADFFLHTKDFTYVRIGMIHPEGAVLAVDASDLRVSRHWRRYADHFPVGGRFSFVPKDPKVDKIFIAAENVDQELANLDQRRFEIKLRSLQAKADKMEVDISEIMTSDKTAQEKIAAAEDALELPPEERLTLQLETGDFEPIR